MKDLLFTLLPWLPLSSHLQAQLGVKIEWFAQTSQIFKIMNIFILSLQSLNFHLLLEMCIYHQLQPNCSIQRRNIEFHCPLLSDFNASYLSWPHILRENSSCKATAISYFNRSIVLLMRKFNDAQGKKFLTWSPIHFKLLTWSEVSQIRSKLCSKDWIQMLYDTLLGVSGCLKFEILQSQDDYRPGNLENESHKIEELLEKEIMVFL